MAKSKEPLAVFDLLFFVLNEYDVVERSGLNREIGFPSLRALNVGFIDSGRGVGQVKSSLTVGRRLHAFERRNIYRSPRDGSAGSVDYPPADRLIGLEKL